MYPLKKMRKLPKEYRDSLLKWLDKNWVEVLLEDIANQSKWFPLVNISKKVSLIASPSSILMENGQSSRIKFKSSHKDISLTLSKWQLTEERSSASLSTHIEDESELLDPTKCYHPECSFAYNIAGDVKRPSLITESLPLSTYQRLAAIWNLDQYKFPRPTGNTCQMQNEEEEEEKVEEFIKSVERDMGIRSEVSEDLQVNPGSPRGSAADAKSKKEPRENPYVKFLKKASDSEMEQRNKANLNKKAGKITKLIIKNFLDWYQSLGGNDMDTLIDESTLHELFQIGFDMPATKALVVKIREMPTVPECLAILRNEPKHATRYGLRQFLKEDIRLENIPPKMFAFGRMLPKERPSLRYKPPKNAVKKTWMECSRVPNDLDTMKTVWAGLEKLRSTIAFANWLKNHPEITPPPYLEQKGLLEINYERWNQMFKGFEMQADTFESVASDPKISQESSSVQEAKFSASSSFKMDSYYSM